MKHILEGIREALLLGAALVLAGVPLLLLIGFLVGMALLPLAFIWWLIK